MIVYWCVYLKLCNTVDKIPRKKKGNVFDGPSFYVKYIVYVCEDTGPLKYRLHYFMVQRNHI